jgi:rhodanese-related sulfurtransferase
MATTKQPSRRFTRKTIVFLILLAAVLLGLVWDGSPLAGVALRQAVALKFRDVRHVSPSELVSWMRDPNRPPPLLVDARPTEQFAISHMDGALQVDPTQPDVTRLDNIPRQTPIVVYDGPGAVGAAMVTGLSQAGFTRVSNLEGGLFRWVNEGHPVVNDQGPATKVHPVSWGWGRLLKARYRP